MSLERHAAPDVWLTWLTAVHNSSTVLFVVVRLFPLMSFGLLLDLPVLLANPQVVPQLPPPPTRLPRRLLSFCYFPSPPFPEPWSLPVPSAMASALLFLARHVIDTQSRHNTVFAMLRNGYVMSCCAVLLPAKY